MGLLLNSYSPFCHSISLCLFVCMSICVSILLECQLVHNLFDINHQKLILGTKMVHYLRVCHIIWHYNQHASKFRGKGVVVLCNLFSLYFQDLNYYNSSMGISLESILPELSLEYLYHFKNLHLRKNLNSYNCQTLNWCSIFE